MELVAIRARVTYNGDRMVYPNTWEQYIEGNYQKIEYPKNEGLNKGDPEEWVLVVVPVDKAEQAISAQPSEYQELSKGQYKTFMEGQKDTPYQVNEAIVAATQARMDAGYTLDQDEQDALDRTKKDVPGITDHKVDFDEHFPNHVYSNTSGFTP